MVAEIAPFRALRRRFSPICTHLEDGQFGCGASHVKKLWRKARGLPKKTMSRYFSSRRNPRGNSQKCLSIECVPFVERTTNTASRSPSAINGDLHR